MKKNKRGFTLVEILICMMVIGTIMALSLQTINIIQTSYASLTYFALRNVQITVRELMSGQTAKTSATNSAVILCKRSDGKLINVLKPDADVASGTIPNCSSLPANVENGLNPVCYKLISMLNTSGSKNCSKLYTATIGELDSEPYISDFNTLNPNFITTNGQRYYITKRTFDAKVSSEYGFRLIGIDLNGKTKPNIIKASSKKMPPDVVTFLVLDNGEVYPLGVAANNLTIKDGKQVQYINALAKGYYYSNGGTGSGNIPADCYTKKNGAEQQTCNYRIVPIQNSQGKSIYSFKEAFCLTQGGNTLGYSDYCFGITPSSLCPPSSEQQRFDTCQYETVKPVFRFIY